MNFDPMQLRKATEWRASFQGAPRLLDYLGEEGGPTLALAFAALFWPTFVEVRGCVLLSDRYEDRNFEEWWQELAGDCRAIEAVANHLHLWDVFDPDDEHVPPEALNHLAEVLGRTWRCALAEQFPDRRFEVEVSDEPYDYGPTVTARSAVT